MSTEQALGTEAIIRTGGMLGRIYQSVAEFTVLTDHLRRAVDERLGGQLSVTGWQDGILRVWLAQPGLATRWRFQEPAVRRSLSRVPALSGLKEIRLTIAAINVRPLSTRPAAASRLGEAPTAAISDLANSEQHDRLRQALTALAEAAAQARQGKPPPA